MEELAAIADYIKQHQDFVITGHSNPDGDCIGSMLALANGLEYIGKDIQLVLSDPVPEVYRYLRGSERVENAAVFTPRCRNVIYVDCADITRCGEDLAGRLKEHGQYFINLDHHASNAGYADLNHIESQVAATAVLIFQLLRLLSVEFDCDIAECLCVAIIQDTGYFKHSNTNSYTLRLVAELLDYGVDLHATQQRLFESRSVAELMLISQALGSLELSDQEQIAWMQLPVSTIERLNAQKLYPEDIVNYCMIARSVEVGILFRELSSRQVKVSFRSKNYVNVAAIAQALGGGGHEKAAGATLKRSLAESIEIVLQAVREVIKA